MPNQWKMGTLRTLVKRTNYICSTDEFLENELNHITKVFYNQNQHPFWATNIFHEIKQHNHQQQQEQYQQQTTDSQNEEATNNRQHFLLLL